jgi:predicted DNA-binding transcriptional regulator AlpA
MTIWRKEHADPPTFPRRVRLSAHAVGWPQDQIESWCLERLAERDRAAETGGHTPSSVAGE